MWPLINWNKTVRSNLLESPLNGHPLVIYVVRWNSSEKETKIRNNYFCRVKEQTHSVHTFTFYWCVGFFLVFFSLDKFNEKKLVVCVQFNEHKNIDQWTYFFSGNKSTWFSLFLSFFFIYSTSNNWMNSGWHTKKTTDNHLVEWLVVTCLTQKTRRICNNFSIFAFAKNRTKFFRMKKNHFLEGMDADSIFLILFQVGAFIEIWHRK